MTAQRMNATRSVDVSSTQLAVFLTEFGWFGLLGRIQSGISIVMGLTIGHASAQKVRDAMRRRAADEFDESDWYPELRQRLQHYTAGEESDFADVEVELPKMTMFQQRVVQSTRRIGYGETINYAELAGKAGFPRAARAVGNVMASNRVPIIIPCHRVVAAGGRLGGFTAPQGVTLKQQMLEMEATCRFAPI